MQPSRYSCKGPLATSFTSWRWRWSLWPDRRRWRKQYRSCSVGRLLHRRPSCTSRWTARGSRWPTTRGSSSLDGTTRWIRFRIAASIRKSIGGVWCPMMGPRVLSKLGIFVECKFNKSDTYLLTDLFCFSRIFGFVARKPASNSDNQCHLFAELEPEQPATAIVNFVNKILTSCGIKPNIV